MDMDDESFADTQSKTLPRKNNAHLESLCSPEPTWQSYHILEPDNPEGSSYLEQKPWRRAKKRFQTLD